MTTIEQIKAEIERRITDNTFGAKLELIDILAWLDTLESEKPINLEGLEKEIEAQLSIFPYTKVSPELPESRWIVIRKELSMFARHFAQWGAEHSGSSEIPNDLEEAAKEYLDKLFGKGKHQPFYKELFISGAKWQKEQMLKEAVEGTVHPDDCEIWVNLVGYGYKFKDGDKVRIIIVG